MFYFRSVITWSYWRYALFSGEAIGKFLAALGALSLCIEIADDFKIYTKDKYSSYGILFLVGISSFYVLSSRRPLSKVSYKVPKKDIRFDVIIGDIFKVNGQIIISSNSTFDTDMQSGLISRNSLQGQLAIQYFEGQTTEIDRQIDKSLENDRFMENIARPGKKREYPIGTVARVTGHGKNFYLVAMSHMNSNKTAYSDVKILDEALEKLWENMASKAELGDIIISAMGTGRGRISLPRKKVVEKIAQSFADASRGATFSNIRL